MRDRATEIQEVVTQFEQLSKEQKILVSCKLANYLTVIARETYKYQSEDVEHPKELRAFNEIQHQLTNQILHWLLNHQDSYTDKAFIKMLVKRAAAIDKKERVIDGIQDAIAKIRERYRQHPN